MKKMGWLTISLLLISFLVRAQDPKQNTLKIAVTPFMPPFVMRGAGDQFYGFDIAMMITLCQQLHFTCRFVPMNFQDLLQAVKTNQVDIAVSGITITAERASQVNFSLPYLVSKARFIGPSLYKDQAFGANLLNNKTIGVQEGSIYPDVLRLMGVQNPTVITYVDVHSLIDALNNKQIDFALTDDQAAGFWQMQSAGLFVPLGKPLTYGYGLGIVFNKTRGDLLKLFNQALTNYQTSNAYVQNYTMYIMNY